MMCGAHANLLSASFYQTGMAANPLVSREAARVFDIDFSYMQWTLGALVPGLTMALVAPWLLYQLVCRRAYQSLSFPGWRRRGDHQTTSGDHHGSRDHLFVKRKQSDYQYEHVSSAPSSSELVPAAGESSAVESAARHRNSSLSSSASTSAEHRHLLMDHDSPMVLSPTVAASGSSDNAAAALKVGG